MNKITQFFKGLSWPVRAYQFGDELEPLQADMSHELVKSFDTKSLKPKVCVLLKQHYFETTRTYPIKNWIHLIQVIRAEAITISPYGAPSLWAITGFEDSSNTYVVTFWSLTDSACALLDQFTFLIPESLLMKFALDTDTIYRIEANKPLFFYHNKSVGIKSMREDALVPTAQRFAELIHCAADAPQKKMTPFEYRTLLLNAVDSLPPWLMCGLFYRVKKEREFNLHSYKWPSIISAIILLTYAMGVSYYQDVQLENIQSEMSSKQQEALEITTIEAKVSERKIKWKAYLAYRKDFPGVTITMSVILNALKVSGAELTNYRLQGNSVTIYGLAPSATKTFEKVVSLPGVSNVKLDGNVSVDKKTGNERFIISLQFEGSRDES